MKNFLFLLLLLTSLSSKADNWIQVADYAAGNRFGASGFSIYPYGYVCAGCDNVHFYRDLWAYDLSNNTWTQKADLPGGKRIASVAFSIQGKGYVGLGYGTASLFYSDLWEYDSDANSWTQKTNYPGAGVYGLEGAVGFAIGNEGYVGTGGGWGSGPLQYSNEFWEYNPSIDQWTQKANFSGGARWGAVGFSIGEKGYVGTGESYVSDTEVYYNDFWEYDPTIDSWIQKTDFSGTKRQWCVGFALNGKGYIGVGGKSENCSNDMWEWNPVNDSWIQKSNYPGSGGCMGTCFSIDSKEFIGLGGYGQSHQDFWEYSPDSITNVSEIANEDFAIAISPNPFTIETHLNSNHLLNNASINIINTEGKVVKSLSGINGNDFTISRSSLISGIYFYELEENKQLLARGLLQIL